MKPIPTQLVIATSNQGKIREIRDLMEDLPIQALSLSDFPDAPEVIEDGETFEENALKKALTLAKAVNMPVLADDSGICVEALDGRPGVRSARYAGKNASDADRVAKLLEELRDVPFEKRSARFVCVIVLAWPDGGNLLFRGICEGRITFEPRGEDGFGYDPIFLYEPVGRTFAEMDGRSKNQVSHRGVALKELIAYLTELVKGTD